MFGFGRKKDLTADEKKVFDLLLSGETYFFKKLQKQLKEPFFRWAERERSQEMYRITIVYDGNLEREYSAGNTGFVNIDDLALKLRRISHPVRARAYIHEGILSVVDLYSSTSVKWPKYFEIEDWGYLVESDGDPFAIKKRPSLDHLKLPDISPGQETEGEEAEAPAWLDKLIQSTPDKGQDIIRERPAIAESIAGLEKEIGESLPADYREFLEWSNGAIFWSEEVLGTRSGREAYLLDDVGVEGRFLVISIDEEGNVTAMDLSKASGETKESPVFYFDHEMRSVEKLADSFQGWLWFVAEAVWGED